MNYFALLWMEMHSSFTLEIHSITIRSAVSVKSPLLTHIGSFSLFMPLFPIGCMIFRFYVSFRECIWTLSHSVILVLIIHHLNFTSYRWLITFEHDSIFAVQIQAYTSQYLYKNFNFIFAHSIKYKGLFKAPV